MITLFIVRPKGFNIGNDAIYLGMRYFLNEAFGETVNLVELPATSRYEVHVSAGLTAKTVHEINQYGHGVIVGGGNLYENGELQIDADALQSLAVPMMLFSLSMGRIFDRQHRLVMRTDKMPVRNTLLLHDQATYSLARDKATFEYLQQIGIRKAILGGCPTLFLDRLEDRLGGLHRLHSKTVFVSIRNPELMSIPLAAKARVREQVDGIIRILKYKGHEDIRLLCHDRRDIPFAASFVDVPYIFVGDIYEYLAILRACALSVSFRLHSIIPCLSFGTPVIGISYDERGLSLMDTIGYGTWNIDLVRAPDCLAEFVDRYEKLATLDSLKRDAKPLWNKLYDAMLESFQAYALEVTKSASNHRRVNWSSRAA